MAKRIGWNRTIEDCCKGVGNVQYNICTRAVQRRPYTHTHTHKLCTVDQQLGRVRIVSGGIFRDARVIAPVRRVDGRDEQHVHRVAHGHRADAHVRRQFFAVETPTDAQRLVAFRDRAPDLHFVARVHRTLAERERQNLRTDCKRAHTIYTQHAQKKTYAVVIIIRYCQPPSSPPLV